MSLELLVTMFSDCQTHPWIYIAGDLDCGIVSIALLDSTGVKRRINLLCHCSELWVCADGQKEGGRKGYLPIKR